MLFIKPWKLLDLCGARVVVRPLAPDLATEKWGTIEAVLLQDDAENCEKAISCALFAVRLDDGITVQISGRNFRRIISKSYVYTQK